MGAARSASRLVTWRWCSQPAVYPGGRFAAKRAAAYPYPFVLCWTELPKIIEKVPVTGIVACAPKHPEVSLAVRPSERIDAAPRDVSSGRNPLGAVHAGLVAKRLRRGRTVQSAAAAHPCPHVRGRVELPKVIENAPYATCSVSLSAKEPEITVSVPSMSLPTLANRGSFQQRFAPKRRRFHRQRGCRNCCRRPSRPIG